MQLSVIPLFWSSLWAASLLHFATRLKVIRPAGSLYRSRKLFQHEKLFIELIFLPLYFVFALLFMSRNLKFASDSSCCHGALGRSLMAKNYVRPLGKYVSSPRS